MTPGARPWGLVEVLVALAFVAVLLVVFGTLIVRAGRLQHPSSLVTALSLLAFLAITAHVLTGEAEPLGIAAAAVGALAGAVAAVYRDRDDPPDS